MKKQSIADAAVIESTKMLIDFGSDPKPVIRGICETHRLTDDFIREFSQYIDEKMFSTSYHLTDSMASKHSYLFNDEIFRNHFFEGRDVYFEPIETDETVENEVEEKITDWASRGKSFDVSMSSRYNDVFNDKMLKEPERLREFLVNAIRSADVSELTVDICILLMGFDNEVDSLLLKRVQDESIREQILLTLSITNDETNISSAAYKYMSNDMKESTLGTENVSFKEFIKVISQSTDIGWQSHMIDRAINNDIEIISTTQSCDSEMLVLINAMNENIFVKFTKLAKYAPNAFSYKIMNWAIINKYFNEDDYISMLDILKRAGCLFQIKKIAKDNSYLKLLSMI